MDNPITEKFRTIARLCQTGADALVIAEATSYTGTTARRYLKIMVDAELLRVETVKNAIRGKPFKSVWYSLKSELTDDDLDTLLTMLNQSNRSHKEIYRIKADEQQKANGVDYAGQVKQILRANEQQGIYRLNTNPSNYFIKKMKESNKQDSKEKKSPKNYAGTSAGMVW